jgi:hypothetical protein
MTLTLAWLKQRLTGRVAIRRPSCFEAGFLVKKRRTGELDFY